MLPFPLIVRCGRTTSSRGSGTPYGGADELSLALLISMRKATARASRGARPRGSVPTGTLAGQVLQVVVLRHWLSEPGGDPDGERVTADTGEVFAEQVRCSRDVASGRSADSFDVMAFPVHRSVTGMAAWCADDGLEIGGGEGEVRVGGDGEEQRLGGPDGLKADPEPPSIWTAPSLACSSR